MRHIFSLILLTAAFVPLHSALNKENIHKELEANRQKLETLSPVRNLWKAENIAVEGDKKKNTFRECYRNETYGSPGDFSKGIPGNLKGRINLADIKVENGIFSFTTRGSTELFWGDFYQRNPEFGEEHIGREWWEYWKPIHVRIRMKQSLPESRWTVSMRKANAGWDKYVAKEFNLKGTGWQTIDVNLCDSRTFYAALNLKTKEAGNRIEIASLEVYTPRLTRVYRKQIELDSEPESAALSLSATPEFKLMINGRPVGSIMRGVGLHNLEDLKQFFHKGSNEIIVAAESKNWSGDQNDLLLEGLILSQSGKSYQIKSDKSWQGQYLPRAGKLVDSDWKPVKVQGREMARFGYQGKRYFLNHPHYGRISFSPVGRKLPIFRSGEEIAFDIGVFFKGVSSDAKLTYRVDDAIGETQNIRQGELVPRQKGGRNIYKLNYAPPRSGVYNITLELSEGKTLLETCRFEAVSTGRIEQRETAGISYSDGLDLKPVSSIDCSSDKWFPMISASQSGNPVKTGLLHKKYGKFLTGGNKFCDFLSWKIHFPNCRRPYLVEIDYPDDKDRIMGISLGVNSYYGGICNDHGNGNWPFAVSGVYTGFQNPVSDQLRTLRMIVFPQLPLATLDVINLLSGSRAAVSAIRIYEICNDLPALKFATRPSRLTGIHAERITEIPNTYYQGDMDRVFADGHEMCKYPFFGFYKAWYISNANLIKYMRFCGENTLIAGLVMYYTGDMYPTKYQSRGSAQADMAALLGEMFAANDLTLLLGVEYSLPDRIYRSNRVTDDQVAAGTSTASPVGADGRQIITWHKIGNINVKEIEQDLYRTVSDLCELYKNNPGIKGIVFQEGSSYNPAFPLPAKETDPLYSDYSDATIARFEQDTGIKVKSDKTGRERFRRRYDWIMKHAREKWLDWRCRRIYQVNRDLAERMRQASPDWTMFIFHGFPYDKAFEPGMSCDEFLRQTGFYPPMYRDDIFCIGRYYSESIRHQSGNAGQYTAHQVFTSSPEAIKLFNSGMKRTALRTAPQFYEPWLRIPKGTWYWDRTLNGSYCQPSGENMLNMYNRLLYAETPYFIAQYWTDMNMPCGFEQERRQFNRAFTVIPPGVYTNLKGNGLDANTIIRASGRHFYVINLLPEKLNLTLSADSATALKDLATGKIDRFQHGRAEIVLSPYGVSAFSLDQGELKAAASNCSEAIAADCRTKVAELRNLSESIRHKLASGRIKAERRKLASDYADFISELSQAVASAHYGWVYMQLHGYKLKKMLSEVRDLASPINWKLVGPFDNPGRKGFEQVPAVEKDLLANIAEKSYIGIGNKPVGWSGVMAESAGKYRGIVNLHKVYGDKSNYQMAYAWAQVYVAEDTPARLLIGSDDGLKIWINGKQVFSIKPERGLTPEENQADAFLHKGWNTIVLKIENNIGGWAFALDIRDRNENDIPSLEYAAN